MGFDAFDPSTYGGALQDAADALNGVVSGVEDVLATQFTALGGNFVADFVAGLVHGQLDVKMLGDDLWECLQAKLTLGKAAVDILDGGDYTAAWNLVTNNGKTAGEVAGKIGHVLPTPATPPGYNAAAVAASALSGKSDMLETSADLYAHGAYALGDKVRLAWANGLVSSPLGAVIAANVAKETAHPVQLFQLARTLESAKSDALVQSTWALHKWGDPAGVFDPIIDSLRAQAKALLAPAVLQTPGLATAGLTGVRFGPIKLTPPPAPAPPAKVPAALAVKTVAPPPATILGMAPKTAALSGAAALMAGLVLRAKGVV